MASRTGIAGVAVLAIVVAAGMAWFGAGHGSPDRPAASSGGGIASLEAAVAARPDDLDAWKRLAETYRARGRRADAVTAYVRAARIAPTDHGVILALRDLAGGQE